MKKSILFMLVVSAFLNAVSQVTRQWVASYNGSGDYNDRYTCVATDGSGNIYTGGSTVNPDVNRDYLIVKLSSSGVLQWSRQFSGTGDGADEITDIAIDGSGNVYVTGFAKGSNTGTDYLTIKLNSNGDSLWTRTYNNVSAYGYDQANSLFVDGSGNVYVTGQSDGDPTPLVNNDYATIKYNSSGAQQWVVRFNGLGDGTDNAVTVVADGSGNVYVTGRGDSGIDDDYVTIKYNSSGAQQWIKYDDRGGNDRATAMTIDGNDNIYITGRSGNNANDDFWTLKYNSAGVLQWQKVYDNVDDDRASAIAVDVSGNVFITGESDGDASALLNWDYQIVAYNASGTQLWQKRYDGSASGNDFPLAISVSSGNVYLTGQSDADTSAAIVNDIVTIAYNSATGMPSWAKTFAGSGGHDDIGNAVVATSSGCVIAGLTEDANTSRNAIAMAYNSSGAEQWQQTFNGIGDNNENIRSLIVDASDNVYVAGYSVQNRTDRDMALVKFNGSGIYVCRQTVNGTSTGSPDDAQGVVLDNAGNAVVVGFTKNSGESNDITSYKVDANCNNIWLNKYPTAAGGSDKIYDIATDTSGNFYITGRVDDDPSFASNDDCFTAKMDDSGSILWSQTYNTSGSNEDRGSFIRVATSGNVYVAGRIFNGSDFDLLMLKYNNSGVQQWVRTYDDGNGNDDVNDFKIDENENIYLCGIAEEANALFDYITLKYNSNGNQVWVRKYNGSGNGNDEAQALAVDDAGNIFVTGMSDADSSSVENQDMVTLKYDSLGNQGWVKKYGGSAEADDIEMLSSDRIILTGHANKNTMLAPNYNIVVFLLDKNGNELFLDEFNSASDSSDIPNLIFVNGNDFYIAGSSVQTGEQRNMLVIKYSFVSGMKESANELTAKVYPNPFTDFLIVNSGNQEAQFELRDALGKIVLQQKIINGSTSISLTSLSEGLYFYRIISEKKEVKGKLIHTN